VGFAIKVHKELGPGLLESVYEKCLKYELDQNGYQVIQQVTVPLVYEELELTPELKLDLLVNDTVVVELKVVETLLPVHESLL
jgi:GxxExxY protein